MQYPHEVYLAAGHAEIQDVRTDVIPVIAKANMIAGMAKTWIGRYFFHSAMKEPDIYVGLVCGPLGTRIVPNIQQVSLGRRR